MYGVEYLREYDPNDPEHLARRDRLCELPSGPRLLPDAFDCILARVRIYYPFPWFREHIYNTWLLIPLHSDSYRHRGLLLVTIPPSCTSFNGSG